MLWLIFLAGVLEVFCTYQHTAETEADTDVAGSSSGHERPLWTDVTEAKAASLHLYNNRNKLSMISQHQHKTNNERGFGRDDVDVATWTQSQSVEKGYASGISEWKCIYAPLWMWRPRAVGFSFLFYFQRSKSRMWACQDPQRINTIAVLRTYGICHLPLGKETLPWLCHHLPFLITSLSLSDFLYVLLLGFKGLKYFSCLLCIKCPHPPSVPKTSQG